MSHISLNPGVGVISGATCTVCKVSHYKLREQKNEEYSNAASPKNQQTYRLLGPVKIEL